MSPLYRRALLAGAPLLLPAVARGQTLLTATPAQTEGPFYPASLPADFDNDLVQVRGQAARAMGTVLHLEGRVLDRAGRPVPGVTVEIWQCDAQGIYDHPRDSRREQRDGAFQGFGRVQVEADARYRFRTLSPVAYPGRAPHIHVAVLSGSARLVSQFYLAGHPRNDRDRIFRAATSVPGGRERIEMRPQDAPGLEAGALAATLHIVLG